MITYHPYEFLYEKFVLSSKLSAIGISDFNSYENKKNAFFIAGGALTSVFSRQPINDLDIFFSSQLELDEFKDKYITGNTETTSMYITANAVSITFKNGTKVQLICKVFGSPEKILSMFDFTVCMAAFIPCKNEIMLDSRFFHNLASKTLVVNELNYPITTMWRANKYIKRGYTLPAGESLKIGLKINALNIKTYHDLKEQLDGIDTLFLKELTDEFIKKGDEEYNYRVAIETITYILNKQFNLENT